VGKNVRQTTKEHHVPVLLLVLLVILILFVLGIAGVVKLLLWIAIILAVLWLIGFFIRAGEGARWYRW
jgi:arginine exporter protein ArgO